MATDSTQPAPELRHVRFARDVFMAHVLSKGDLTLADVELLASLGSECRERGGDADVLDQLAFRLRGRLTAQLEVVAMVRRGREGAETAAC